MTSQHPSAHLKDLGIVVAGNQVRAAQHDPAGRYLLIQPGDVGPEGLDLRREVRMTLKLRRERDAALRPGDLVLRGRGETFGALALDTVPPDAVAVAPLVVFRPDPRRIVPGYVAWFINRPATQAILTAQAHGTHIPTVGAQTFAELEILVPPVADQRRIAQADALLRHERALTQALLERRQALAQATLEEFLTQGSSL